MVRIVVVGAGKLGYSIAELLSKEAFDVVVVDQDADQLEGPKNTLDVLTIHANGASPITMNEPDIRGADILIAVTASDEVNMVACILAKKHGIAHTIARIRDMQFMGEAKEYLKENFDIDLMLNPELITAAEINRILMTPAALNVEDFAHGKVRLFETRVRRSSPFARRQLRDIELPPGVLAGMIFRDHRMIIPHGDDYLLPHDNAYFIGIPEQIEKFSQNFVQRDARRIHRVMVIGAGRAGRALATMLDGQGVEVKVIDRQHERCQRMAGFVPTLLETKDEMEFNKLFARIEKYENITDSMEMEIASYLNKVSEGRLSDASKTQIQKMLRQISELESIGDSVYNLGRTLNRHRMHCQESFTADQMQHMMTMLQLVDAALTEMLKRIDLPTTKNGVKVSLNIEHEINNYRTQLKNQNLHDVNAGLYDYQLGVF